MSKQEPKDKTFDVLRFVADNAGMSIFEAIEKAYNMGASEQEPKIGHWLKDSRGTLCSICRGYAIDDEGLVILTDYCPWCGAKMEVEE